MALLNKGLVIKIGADVNEAVSGINQVNNKLNTLNPAVRQSNLSFQALKNGIAQIGFTPLAIGAGLLTTALFGLFSKTKQAAVDFSYLADQVKIAKDAQKEFEANVRSAATAVVGQAKNISDLRDIIISTTSVNNQLTDSIIKQGVARALFNEKNKTIQDQLASQIERELILRKRSGGGVLSAPEFIFDPQINQLKKLQNTLQGFGKSDAGLNKDIKRLEELNEVLGASKGSLNFINNLSKGFEDLFKGFVDGPVKEIKLKKLDVKADKIRISGELGEMPSPNPRPSTSDRTASDPVVDPDPRGDFKRRQEIIKHMNEAAAQGFARQREEAEQLAETISGTLAPAFSSMFSAILEGKDPLKAMFQTLIQSVQQLVAELIQAAIKSLVLKIIASIGTGGTSNLMAIASGFRFNATGGPIQKGIPTVVGETGRELFIPSETGRIIPNNSLGGLQGSATPTIIFNGRLAVTGQELQLLLNRTDRYNSTNV